MTQRKLKKKISKWNRICSSITDHVPIVGNPLSFEWVIITPVNWISTQNDKKMLCPTKEDGKVLIEHRTCSVTIHALEHCSLNKSANAYLSHQFRLDNLEENKSVFVYYAEICEIISILNNNGNNKRNIHSKHIMIINRRILID